ncbi:MAG: putative Response regulator receiver modulated Serine phosphatase, partial [Nitrospira sp.]|nr:putative Response regulator receiver modulated Serine phosphatase [Nitrospira sp.]
MAYPAQWTTERTAAEAAKPAPVILLVDDDDITRTGMAARLKRLGYRVIEAADGNAGLSATRIHRP